MVSKVEPEGEDKDKDHSSSEEEDKPKPTPPPKKEPCCKIQTRVVIAGICGIIFYLAMISCAIAIMVFGAANGGWRKGALDAHNKYRKVHSVPKLVFHDDLIDSAQKCAEYLAKDKKMEHVCAKEFGHKYGENLWSLSGSLTDPAKAATGATTSWYDEVSKHDFKKNSFQPTSGHFSQVVWKSSARLGIGYAANGDWNIVVGHYDPPGNMDGEFLKNVLDKASKAGGQLRISVLIAAICGIVIIISNF